MPSRPLKIVYVTPALYMAGGVERVLTLKANYFSEHFGYDITIILTEGRDKPLFYPLNERVGVVNLGIDFEELWTCPFLKKVWVYLGKQRRYKRMLTAELMRIRPDVTISLLRREINFICDIPDGSRKIGELHINRAHYRNFDAEGGGVLKRAFARWWSASLVSHLKRLDRLVVLTEKDREAWTELPHVVAIPDPLSFSPRAVSPMSARRVVAIARYSHEKGIDLLLQAWVEVQQRVAGWRLDVFGDGDRTAYEQMAGALQIDSERCQLHGRTSDVEREYCASSLFVLSSRFEGFGMVITEAMACGLPVVAFDCPWGPRSIISDGEDGLLADNGNPRALADKLVRVMTDDALRIRMARAARHNVGRFSMEAVGVQWKALIDGVTTDF